MYLCKKVWKSVALGPGRSCGLSQSGNFFWATVAQWLVYSGGLSTQRVLVRIGAYRSLLYNVRKALANHLINGSGLDKNGSSRLDADHAVSQNWLKTVHKFVFEFFLTAQSDLE